MLPYLSLICIGLMFLEVLITYIATYNDWGVEGNIIFNKIVKRPVLMLMIGEFFIISLCMSCFYLPGRYGNHILSFLTGLLTARVVNNIYMMLHMIHRKKVK